MRWKSLFWGFLAVTMFVGAPVEAATQSTGYVNVTNFRIDPVRYGVVASYLLDDNQTHSAPEGQEAFVFVWNIKYVGKDRFMGDPTQKFLLLDTNDQTYAPDDYASWHAPNAKELHLRMMDWKTWGTITLTTVYLIPKGTTVAAIITKDGRLYFPLNQRFDLADYPPLP